MDDILGTFVLNLADVYTTKPQFQGFRGDVYLHGKAAGSISGKIRITLPSKLDKLQEGFIPIPRMEMAKCACLIT
uniref:AlNc14C8G1066 protein n=1 Tax=Albugo laibachii Nc14 TaxID=890382 RepID=F0W1Y7_9STRA|nr:AlNc14C8G1066 [Albugo laibachii Nc14]|eukprot:CCA15066.1 AlNc14C8G1066 [Albugo laibachii Nc14]